MADIGFTHEQSPNDDDRRKRKDKKDRGYSTLSRASSEEELVVSKSASKPKKGNVFAKLHTGRNKDKSKTTGPQSPVPLVKAKMKSKSTFHQDVPYTPTPSRPVFGVPLEEAERNNKCHDGVPLPVVVRQCIDYVGEHGLEIEGIYRLSPPKSKLDDYRRRVDNGESITLDDPHAAAALLKLFLRELPSPLICAPYKQPLQAAAAECPCKTAYCACLAGDRVKALLKKLPPSNYMLLAYLFNHLQDVIKNEKHNKMGVASVGLILQPTLDISQPLLRILLQNTATSNKQATCLFTDMSMKRYVSPRRPPPERVTQDLPTSLQEMEEELGKQQSLLTQLHEQVANMRAQTHPHLPIEEEQLWNVQLYATQLKRKLRSLKAKSNKDSSEIKVQAQSPGPCPQVFEEKQLLAVNTELQHSIRQEQAAINNLREKLALLQQNCAPLVAVEEEDQGLLQQIDVLHNANNILVEEIVGERLLCAQLTALLEMKQVTRL